MEEFTEEKIESVIENYLFPQIFHICIERVAQPGYDALFTDQCNKFSNLTQYDLKIDEGLICSDLVPWKDAIDEMRELDYSFTPTKKLYTILNSAKAIFKRAEETNPTSTIGGKKIKLYYFIILLFFFF